MTEPTLRIEIDRERCMGSGVCSFHAPATFDLDDACKAIVVGLHDPEDAIRNAAESCPQRAITITEVSTRPAAAPLDLTLFGDQHVRRYEETDGAEGYLWNGAPCLVLHTTGRRTGEPRKAALIFGEVDGTYVLVASRGGAPSHPAWYQNLVAEPNVVVQVRGDRFAATARTATGPERDRLWHVMAGIWPSYDEYATRTTRSIPVVVLERVAR